MVGCRNLRPKGLLARGALWASAFRNELTTFATRGQTRERRDSSVGLELRPAAHAAGLGWRRVLPWASGCVSSSSPIRRPTCLRNAKNPPKRVENGSMPISGCARRVGPGDVRLNNSCKSQPALYQSFTPKSRRTEADMGGYSRHMGGRLPVPGGPVRPYSGRRRGSDSQLVTVTCWRAYFDSTYSLRMSMNSATMRSPLRVLNKRPST